MHHTEQDPGFYVAPTRRAINGRYEHALPNPISFHIGGYVNESTVVSFFRNKTRRYSEIFVVEQVNERFG